jgi:hypothetical protein
VPGRSVRPVGTWLSTLSPMKWALPSQNTAFTPPGWRLRGLVKLSLLSPAGGKRIYETATDSGSSQSQGLLAWFSAARPRSRSLSGWPPPRRNSHQNIARFQMWIAIVLVGTVTFDTANPEIGSFIDSDVANDRNSTANTAVFSRCAIGATRTLSGWKSLYRFGPPGDLAESTIVSAAEWFIGSVPRRGIDEGFSAVMV